MLCHPEPHPAVNYALRNVKSQNSSVLKSIFFASDMTSTYFLFILGRDRASYTEAIDHPISWVVPNTL